MNERDVALTSFIVKICNVLFKLRENILDKYFSGAYETGNDFLAVERTPPRTWSNALIIPTVVPFCDILSVIVLFLFLAL